MRIGQLARECDCPPETIRYYEKVELLPAPRRDVNGYRYYEESHRNWLLFILRSRELGFTQDEVRRLTDIAHQRHPDCAKVHDLLVDHMNEVQGKLLELQRMERALKRLATTCGSGSLKDCPVIDELMRP